MHHSLAAARALSITLFLTAACGGTGTIGNEGTGVNGAPPPIPPGGGSTGSGGTGSTTTTTGGGPSMTGGGGEPEQQCVDIINGYRATQSLPPYARWTDQEACASAEAGSDSQSGKAHGAFGMCGESAQNECPGYTGSYATMLPRCLDLMWKEGPGTDFSKHGHYINMSNAKYTKVACGFATTAAGKIWAVQDFK